MTTNADPSDLFDTTTAVRVSSFPPTRLPPLPDRPPVRELASRELDPAEALPSQSPYVEPETAAETQAPDERPRRRRPSQLNARSSSGRTLYERIGRTIGVRRLVRRFFDLMESLPEAAPCRAVFPVDLDDSRQKLFEFLNGWLGGPKLYLKRRGAPKLRRRHFLMTIGAAQRDAWLACFRRAAEETITDRGAVDMLMPQVESLAYYLQNRD